MDLGVYVCVSIVHMQVEAGVCKKYNCVQEGGQFFQISA